MKIPRLRLEVAVVATLAVVAIMTAEAQSVERRTVLFTDDILRDGVLGTRAESTQYCRDLSLYTQLQCTSTVSLLNYRDDLLIDFPTKYGLNASHEVISPNNFRIAENWTRFVDGSEWEGSLLQAQVTQHKFWLGTRKRCNEWSTASQCLNGGIFHAASNLYQEDLASCGTRKAMLCVCLNGIPIGTPQPTTLSPTDSPTWASPTRSPTSFPTLSPTTRPTNSPTQFPTRSPTKQNTETPTISPTKNVLYGVTSIDVGVMHACAIIDGGIKCWGGLTISNDTVTFFRSPTWIPGWQPGSGVEALCIGEHHTCFIKSGQVYCWGSNEYGQAGQENGTIIPDPSTVTGIPYSAVSITCGTSHTCTRLVNNHAYCWGLNDHGQLGSGSTSTSAIPVRVFTYADIIGIYATTSSTCVARLVGSSNETWCFGDNSDGQLGIGNAITPQLSAVRMNPDYTGGVSLMSGGNSFFCGIQNSNGAAFCMGRGGSLGNGDDNDRSTITAVTGLDSNVRHIDCALHDAIYRSCAVLNSGEARCWGYFPTYYPCCLGNGNDDIIAFTPQTVDDDGPRDFKQIAVGNYVICAIRGDDNEVWCWGTNEAGLLGVGSTNNNLVALVPQPVLNGESFYPAQATPLPTQSPTRQPTAAFVVEQLGVVTYGDVISLSTLPDGGLTVLTDNATQPVFVLDGTTSSTVFLFAGGSSLYEFESIPNAERVQVGVSGSLVYAMAFPRVVRLNDPRFSFEPPFVDTDYVSVQYGSGAVCAARPSLMSCYDIETGAQVGPTYVLGGQADYVSSRGSAYIVAAVNGGLEVHDRASGGPALITKSAPGWFGTAKIDVSSDGTAVAANLTHVMVFNVNDTLTAEPVSSIAVAGGISMVRLSDSGHVLVVASTYTFRVYQRVSPFEYAQVGTDSVSMGDLADVLTNIEVSHDDTRIFFTHQDSNQVYVAHFRTLYTAQPTRSPTFTSHGYSVSPATFSSWYQAAEYCVSTGSHLAMPLTALDISSATAAALSSGEVWVGGEDSRWMNGLAMNTTALTSNTGCAYLDTAVSGAVDLDATCSGGPRVALCERRSPRFFRVGFNRTASWHEAKALCASRGAQIASLTSDTDLWLARHIFSLGVEDEDDAMWVGMTDNNTEGEWVWDSGLPVHQNDTEGWWAKRWYDHRAPFEDCAAMLSSGLLDEIQCDDSTVANYVLCEQRGDEEAHYYYREREDECVELATIHSAEENVRAQLAIPLNVSDGARLSTYDVALNEWANGEGLFFTGNGGSSVTNSTQCVLMFQSNGSWTDCSGGSQTIGFLCMLRQHKVPSPTTMSPTQFPSRSPTTSQPTRSPTTSQPTTSPTTSQPTRSPTTSQPTTSPSTSPTTSVPTKSPSTSPSTSPTTSVPTKSPTQSPTTSVPTKSPTQSPTTSLPTKSPTTSVPTKSPTQSPTQSPTTSVPTKSPTQSPTQSPTTSVPTKSPTTSVPTKSPTQSPTKSPTTSVPTKSPTQSPTTSAPSVSPTTSAPTRSPTRTPVPGTTQYFISSLTYTRDNAAAFCRDQGAQLASIISAEENSAAVTAAGGQEAWLSFTDQASEGNWFWLDGSMFGGTYSNWFPGKPANPNPANCAVLQVAGTWFDIQCESLRHALCERRSPGYFLINHALTWVQARDACEEQGAILASITSIGENNLARHHMGAWGTAWIGLNDYETANTWRWRSGVPTSYTNWDSGWPYATPPAGEDCAFIQSSNGLWRHFLCSSPGAALCERRSFPHYYLINTVQEYAPARTACMNQGATLATINSYADWSRSVWAHPGATVWIGLNDAAVEGTWRWDSNDAVTAYMRWDGGEPNNAGNEDYTHQKVNGLWNDVPTTVSARSLCMVATRPDIVSETKYFLSSVTYTRDGAAEFCRQQGLQLASIVSAAEQANAQIAANGIAAWLSLNDRVTEGTWRWLDERLGTDVYSNWGAGEGTNGPIENCVAMAANGLWGDGQCSVSFRALCERRSPGYFHVNTLMTWEQARVACEQQGAVLASVTSTGERNLALYHMGEAAVHAWIGLNDLQTTNTWRWRSGVPASNQVFWAGGYPNPSAPSGHDCVLQNAYGSWEQVDCYARATAICERRAYPHYYVIGSQNVWAAGITCWRLGGSMAVIQNDAQWVRSIVSAAGAGGTWFDLTDSAVEGTYRWGFSNELVTYFKWAGGQPNAGTAGPEDYGWMGSSGRWALSSGGPYLGALCMTATQPALSGLGAGLNATTPGVTYSDSTALRVFRTSGFVNLAELMAFPAVGATNQTNIALGTSVTQSTSAFGAPSTCTNGVVIGVDSGICHTTDAANQWIQANLGSGVPRLGDVMVWNRQNPEIVDRILNTYTQVMVNGAVVWQFPTYYPRYQYTYQLAPPVQNTGYFVQISRTGECINLREVEVYRLGDNTRNIARGRPVELNTDYGGGTNSIHCTDGVIPTTDSEANICHTGCDAGVTHTLTIRLGPNAGPIGRIVIYNRIGSGRLTGGTVAVGYGSETLWSTTVGAYQAVYDYTVTPVHANPSANIYIFKSNDYIHLAEIQVYYRGAETGTNIALGKTVSQSSIFDNTNYPPSECTDGVTATTWNMCHTQNTGFQWIQVDLGALTRPIGRIRILNRVECCQDRAIGLTVQLRYGTEVVWSSVITDVRADYDFYLTLPPYPPTTTFIQIIHPSGAPTFLHIGEIEAYQNALGDPGVNIARGRTVTQSSILNNLFNPPSKCTDGVQYVVGNWCSTNGEAWQWIQVDLGALTKPVRRIRIWNRADGDSAITGRIVGAFVELYVNGAAVWSAPITTNQVVYQWNVPNYYY